MNLARLSCVSFLLCAAALPVASADDGAAVRIATFNTSLNRPRAGQLAEELASGDSLQAQQVAEILQRVRPDIVLLNEVDYDSSGKTIRSLQQLYLEKPQNGQPPIQYPWVFLAPVNTGIPSGLDLDGNGRSDGPGDALGFGRFPGQYGMVILSRYRIEHDKARTFQKMLWNSMPAARLPVDPESGESFYAAEALDVLPLSSKSHWDVPVQLQGTTLHLLASHPTPPVFDGKEDRNGCRNHDEIRFWSDYLSPTRAGYLRDDRGRKGGLDRRARFVILGDLNADPADGESVAGAIGQLLEHPRVNSRVVPRSEGAEEAGSLGKNVHHRGPAAEDTADFADNNPGNLRVDYVLPSRTLVVSGSGVFWPRRTQPTAALLKSSDHRLVWIDIERLR